jgi:DNA-binding response OmpR family regulator
MVAPIKRIEQIAKKWYSHNEYFFCMTTSKHILIVEDEHAIAKALQLKMQHSGFSVETAVNGQEALALCEKKKNAFDLILLDLIMPIMNGFDFLAALKEKGIHIPVIVSSNLSQEEDMKRAKELGAADYYVKSEIPIADVVTRVQKTLNA